MLKLKKNVSRFDENESIKVMELDPFAVLFKIFRRNTNVPCVKKNEQFVNNDFLDGLALSIFVRSY